jgi:RNA polymerase sigma factor (sigma-70 family)
MTVSLPTGSANASAIHPDARGRASGSGSLGPTFLSDPDWEQFVERYSRLLLRVAFDFGPGYDRAMDRYAFILDELRRNDCRRLRRYDAGGRARFSTWLVTVARRLCVDEYRSRYGRRRSGSGDRVTSDRWQARTAASPVALDLDRLPDLRAADPADCLSEAERSRAVRLALEGLPPPDRRLLDLFFGKEYSARQVAETLGLPTPFHVYRRVRRVLGGLRLALERAGVKPDADR